MAPPASVSRTPRSLGSPVLGGSGLVAGLAVKCCPPVPPAQLRLSRVSRALHAASDTLRSPGEGGSRVGSPAPSLPPPSPRLAVPAGPPCALGPPCAASPAPAQVSAGPEALARPALAVEAPYALDVEPDSDDDWNALLDAHGFATPADGAAAAVTQSAKATGAGRRARDQCRRRLRKSAKRSMWRES